MTSKHLPEIKETLFIILTGLLLITFSACTSNDNTTNYTPPEPEKELTGNIFLDAESSVHASKSGDNVFISGYTRIDFEAAKEASMEDFVEFAFSEVKSSEKSCNWYTLEFLNENGGGNGKGICFYGCDPYVVKYGKISKDGSIYEEIGMLTYNEETSSYEYEPMPEEE